MNIEVQVRITCSVGKCNRARTPAIFEGWMPATVDDVGNIKLYYNVPGKWTVRTMLDTGEKEPVCHVCTKKLM